MAVRRRQFERHPFRLPVTVVWGDTCLETCTHTLALGGLFAVCGDPPPAGTAVSVAFRLPDPDGEVKLRLAGEVVYTTSEGIGVRFLDLDREARGKLRTFFILQDLHCYNTETMEP